MPVVALNIFRFSGAYDKAWAFSQMQWARAPLRQLKDLQFFKLFGTGGKESFHPYPNFGVYAVLTVWPDLHTALERVASAPVLQRYRDHSLEHYQLCFSPLQSRGSWDRRSPFEPDETLSVKSDGRPVAVLTRATIRARHLVRFWRHAPSISAMTTREPDMLFKLGMGEIPWLHQVTFSIWTSQEAMVNFAYRNGDHARAVATKRREDWFKEELFARFILLDHQGSWGGVDPIAAQAKRCDDPVAA